MADQELRQAERAFQQETSTENAERLLTQQHRTGQTHQQVFLVMFAFYNYDDEAYTVSNDGYNKPTKAFVSMERAKQFLLEDDRSAFLEFCAQDGGHGSGLGSWASNHSLFPDDLPTDVDAFLQKIGINYDALVISQGSLSDNMEDFGLKVLGAYQENKIPNDILDKIIEASGLTFNTIVTATLQDGICGGIRG